MAIEDLLRDKIFGNIATRPRLRLIDLCGIQFVMNGSELGTAAFRTLYLAGEERLRLVCIVCQNVAASNQWPCRNCVVTFTGQSGNCTDITLHTLVPSRRIP
jgi:hypothetical protein